MNPIPCLFSLLLAATSAPLAEYDGLDIVRIEIVSDDGVKPKALARQFALQVGDRFDAEQWEEDVRMLFNRALFTSLETDAERQGDGVALTLTARTSFALLPFLAYQGGSVPIYIVGAAHGNLFGQVIEVGAYYMRRGPYNLGRAWTVFPNILGYGTTLDLELVTTGEILANYPSPLGLQDGLENQYPADSYPWTVPASGAEMLRRGFFADFGYQVVPRWLLLSLRYSLLFETTRALPNFREVTDRENRGLSSIDLLRGPADRARLSLLSFTAQIGRIDLIDNYRFLGSQLTGIVVGGHKLFGSERDFMWLYLTHTLLIELLPRVDLGLRTAVAHSTSSDRRVALNLGGFNLEPFVFNQRHPGLLNIRGFRDHHFHGSNLYFANIEPRFAILPDWQLPWIGGVAISAAAFGDAGYVWSGPWASHAAFDDIYASAGLGMLVSLKKFRQTYVNWYVSRTMRPFVSHSFDIVFTRPFL